MPIAAVPGYLGKDFEQASPGMRFGMYLAIWTDRPDQEKEVNHFANKKSPEAGELRSIRDSQGMDAAIEHMRRRKNFPGLWNKNDHAANKSWSRLARLGKEDLACIQALADRQSVLARVAGEGGQLFIADAESVAPFTTGLGNEHPLENGFAFLWPYGLPYLPGSGVKGVLRQAARELAGLVDDAQWDIASEWTKKTITALFGSEDSNHAQRGALQFWDVIPNIKGNHLMVEVMTGHQSHYYMKGESPHDSGQPIPVNFLTVPPGSGFTFHVLCDVPFLQGLCPGLAAEDRWKVLLRQAFEHAFEWLGFGAKTAVGYGAMRVDTEVQRQREEEQRSRQEQAAREARLKSALDGLPEDAAWIERKRMEGAWSDNNAFLTDIESLLAEGGPLSSEALTRLSEEMENRWKGIMQDPDATKGKKQKPKYKDRPRALAKRLIQLREG